MPSDVGPEISMASASSAAPHRGRKSTRRPSVVVTPSSVAAIIRPSQGIRPASQRCQVLLRLCRVRPPTATRACASRRSPATSANRPNRIQATHRQRRATFHWKALHQTKASGPLLRGESSRIAASPSRTLRPGQMWLLQLSLDLRQPLFSNNFCAVSRCRTRSPSSSCRLVSASLSRCWPIITSWSVTLAKRAHHHHRMLRLPAAHNFGTRPIAPHPAPRFRQTHESPSQSRPHAKPFRILA